MSLQIWLPFNGISENQGMDNDAIISGNLSFDSTQGKIGYNCLDCSNTITINTSKLKGQKILTFAFWAYVNSSLITANWTLIARIKDQGTNSGSDMRIETCPKNYSNGIYCFSNHNNSNYGLTTGCIRSPNGGYYDQWVHFCFTSDGETFSRYMNGELIGTCNYDGLATFSGQFILANNDKILKQDIRIYDECLNIKQIKELSKGLVAHYKLSKHVDSTLTPDDSDYHTFGYDSNIERDVSGNGYDLEYSIIEPEVDDNSALNKNSFKFTQGLKSTDSGQQYLSRPYFNFLTDNFTFSCWINQSNRTSYSSGTEKPLQFILSQGRDYDTYGFNIMINDGRVDVYIGNSTDKAIIGSNELSLFTWHLITCTYDGSIAKLYIDGVLVNQQSVTSIDYKYANDRFVIGKMSYSYTYNDRFFPFVGNISDVRIYSTVLSDNDIKDLYELRASLDKDGNYYTNNIMEE